MDDIYNFVQLIMNLFLLIKNILVKTKRSTYRGVDEKLSTNILFTKTHYTYAWKWFESWTFQQIFFQRKHFQNISQHSRINKITKKKVLAVFPHVGRSDTQMSATRRMKKWGWGVFIVHDQCSCVVHTHQS